MMNASRIEELTTRFTAGEWSGRKPAYASGGPLTIPADAPATFTEAILRREKQADRGVTYIRKDGREDFQGYADLVAEARCILTGLRKLGLQPGDRAILQIDDLRHHFTAFWACVLGGFTPVTVAVAPSYTDKNGVVNKLWNTWKLLKGPLIITSANLENAIKGLAVFMEMPGLRAVAVEPLQQHDPASEIHPSKPADLVFFQLTSGSTGIPKCIQETHRGIIHHIHGAQQFNGYKPENITLNWLPVDHVVPILTSHLKDVYLGIQQIHVQSALVLSDPLRWLDLMEKHRVTHTWSPNFGFKLVSDRLAREPDRKWDLSRIEFMMNAGEQVTLPVVSDFLARTAPFGIRPQAMQPAFGMAEVCTCMTYQNEFTVQDGIYRFKKSSLGGILADATPDDPAAVSFVDLGPPVPGVEIRITDSQNRVVPERVVGRFQIRGAVVTPGYLDNDAANQEAFVGDGWFNSGDLGFILNGRLTLTGREKEMIIVRGANFYCYEIEDVVNSIAGIEPTFVSSSAVPNAGTGTEGLAIFFAPKPAQGFQPDGAPTEKLLALTREIKAKVATSLGINPSFVVPLRPEHFLKTTSGKIQRGQMKKNFEAGEYDEVLRQIAARVGTVSPIAATDNVEARLVRIWRELFDAPGLGVKDDFFAAGGDSLLAARVLARVHDAFQVELPLHVLFHGGATVEGMAEHIRHHDAKTATVPPIKPRSEKTWAPASLGQQRLWLLDQMNPGSPAYNVGTLTRLTGPLEVSKLEDSLARLMARHESLRARFEVARGQVCQIFDVPAISIGHEEISASDHETIYRAGYKEAAQPFDLRTGPLLRARLFQTGPAEHYLVLTLHQTIVDGWSLKLLFQELAENVARPASLPSPALPIQYGDYSVCQRDWFEGEAVETPMNYWRKELAGPLPEADLPIDLPRPQNQTDAGDTQVHYLSAELSDALRDFAKGQGTTIFMALLAAYQAFLSRITSQDEVIVGTAIAGRGRTELENLIGFFVNTVAMRAALPPDTSFAKLLAQTRDKTVAAYEHQSAPFEKIVAELQPAPRSHSRSRPPIFQVWFGAWEALPELAAGELTFTPVKVFMPGAQFELSLFAIDRPEIELIWEYRRDLFLPASITRLRAQFENLLRRLVENPDTPLPTIFTTLEESRLRDRLRAARSSRRAKAPARSIVRSSRCKNG